MDTDTTLEIDKTLKGCLKKPSSKKRFIRPLEGGKRNAKKVDFGAGNIPRETKKCACCGFRNVPPKNRELFGCEDCGKNVCGHCVTLPHVQCFGCRELRLIEDQLKALLKLTAPTK